jgi:hypothetical protein
VLELKQIPKKINIQEQTNDAKDDAEDDSTNLLEGEESIWERTATINFPQLNLHINGFLFITNFRLCFLYPDLVRIVIYQPH